MFRKKLASDITNSHVDPILLMNTCSNSTLNLLVKVLSDNRLVESCSLLELVLLHEQSVCHVQFPDVALVAKLNRLPEQFFHLLIVF